LALTQQTKRFAHLGFSFIDRPAIKANPGIDRSAHPVLLGLARYVV
jgi:hypothetical protein